MIKNNASDPNLRQAVDVADSGIYLSCNHWKPFPKGMVESLYSPRFVKFVNRVFSGKTFFSCCVCAKNRRDSK